jgi:hypothetical protein
VQTLWEKSTEGLPIASKSEVEKLRKEVAALKKELAAEKKTPVKRTAKTTATVARKAKKATPATKAVANKQTEPAKAE